jgi:eukaryotic-like serine/threonine-protein kinase
MSTNIGRFEILGELAKSESGCIYKASDPETGQTVALKTYQLDKFGEHGDALLHRILQEADTTKDLNSANITLLYGAGEIDGQFCAAMEYVQGNSIATMLARREGFSIWDLLDISRQVCQALDHAHGHDVFHFSLEPAKVMVTWDGTVKVLSFGVSSAGWVAASAMGAPSSVLHYMAPEQVSGEKLNACSNLFTWGAILYEMVTDQKAFDGVDADEVRHKILNEMPVSPALVNPKINPVASDVIMKALAKNPAERYQSGHEMANDLERCRESSGKTAKKANESPKSMAVAPSVKAAAAAKFAAAPTQQPAAPSVPVASRTMETRPSDLTPSLSDELETSWTPTPAKAGAPQAPKAAAAAAGWNAPGASSAPKAQHLDPSAQFASSAGKPPLGATNAPTANMSSAVADEPVTEQPRIAVDPMMAENAGHSSNRVSFSEMDELPPLKEVYIAPPAPKTEVPEADEPLPSIILRKTEPEKPRIQPREVAEKALKEIKSIPPQLMMYSISAAIALILFVGVLVWWRSQSQSTDEEGRVPTPAAAPATRAPAPEQSPAPAQQPSESSAQIPEASVAEPAAEPVPIRGAAPARARTGKNKKAPAPPAAAIPGQLAVDSTPEGAQLQIDGRTDPNWVTPYTLAGLPAGSHTVVVSKSGFTQESRSIDVVSGSKAFLVVHLASLNATITVSSEPAGASIFLDGKDTLRVTPSMISLEKGTHTILVRKPGYLDETTSASGQAGQTFHFAPTLRALGSTDEIKTVGKFKKLFGGSATAGMSKVSIKTSPKGAQIAINRRVLDKTSPVEFLLNPGNYIVDITLTGYKPVQKVITVEQSGGLSIDETLQIQ